MPGSADPPFELLRIALRSRAATVAELAGLALRSEPEVRADLVELAGEGLLVLDGDRIRYRAPAEGVAEAVRHRVEDLGAEMDRRLAALAALVDQVPGLAREWSTGAELLQPLDVEIFHGPEAVVDLWHLRQGREPSRRTDVMLPDASRLYVADPDMQQVWHDAIRGEGRHARVLAALEDATHPEAQERIAQELAGGVQIRLMAAPPSWFWITDASTVALPLVWGERWPTSVMAVRSHVVADLAGWLFERLWEQAVPVDVESDGWDSLLVLMRGGATLEAASRLLGISERTGRRRLAAAMEHYGAASMLALGVAWGAARSR
ncbi:hypothetical protein [Nocardioides pantholopis]|uniref:hypothetical protein n=1 Tax=Nocardioides pantholopis TaxID=2483798 RepID=UPI000F09461E|nr:hypothetical protein [Nocardioides pantholopis]